jgi:GntR family transcriptional regulator/MocR family aminotransferase
VELSGESLQRQIYARLRAAILSGQLQPGTQIPSSRELARELRVGRNTILAAIEQLTNEGYLQSARGSGTFVHRTLPYDGRFAVPKAVRRAVRAKPYAAFPTRIRKLTQLPALLPPSGDLRPFLPCVPAVDAFPFALWGRLAAHYWRRPPVQLFSLGEAAGYAPLRHAVADYLGQARAVRCEPEQVIIVSGAQQALDLVARVLLEPGDTVWMEDPGYQGARASLMASGARVVPVPVDDDGLSVKRGRALAPRARLVYCTPSHQFPLGHTMSLARRLELLAWARQTRAWILEDDYDSEYRYGSRPIPSLQGLAESDQVIYTGTFSKVLFPSLRLGYLVVPDALVDTFSIVRSIATGPSSTMEQAVLTRFIEQGHFGRHLRRMRALYQERLMSLQEAVTEDLAGVIDLAPTGAGLHAVGTLPAGVDDQRVLARAAQAGLDFIPLSSLYQGSDVRHGLVFGFAPFTPATIRTSVRTFAQVLARRPRGPNKSVLS